MTRNRWLYFAGYALLVAMIAVVLLDTELRRAMARVSLLEALTLLAVASGGLTALGLQFRAAAAVLGLKLKPREWFGLTSVNTIVSYVVPARGGLVVRAAYLKRVYDMSIGSYSALTAASLGLTVIVACTIGLILALVSTPEEVRLRTALVFVSVALVLVALGLISIALRPRSGRIWSGITAFRAGMGQFITHRRQTAFLIVWTLAFYFVQATGLFVAFKAVGSDVDFFDALIIHSGTVIAFLVAVTPGGLGVKEGTVVFITALLGVDTGLALTAALLDRAMVLTVTAIGALLGGRPLLSAVVAARTGRPPSGGEGSSI